MSEASPPPPWDDERDLPVHFPLIAKMPLTLDEREHACDVSKVIYKAILAWMDPAKLKTTPRAILAGVADALAVAHEIWAPVK